MAEYKVGDKVYVRGVIEEINEDTVFPYAVNIGCAERGGVSFTHAIVIVNEKAMHDADGMTPEEAWEIARKTRHPLTGLGMTLDEITECFGCDCNGILDNYTPQEVKAKIKAWEKAIHINNIVKYEDGTKAVVLDTDEDEGTVIVYTENGCVEEQGNRFFKKTGESIDVRELFFGGGEV